MKLFKPAAAVLIAGMSAAAPAAQAQLASDLPPSAVLLVRFDADKDGAITKAEMEAGLKVDYAEADLDHNNCLNAPEVRAENERRLRREGGQATPLVDWNVDGCVNMQEFAATTRSYFTFADRSKDGMHGVTADTVSRELKDAGLEVVSSEAGAQRWFMVVASKPSGR